MNSRKWVIKSVSMRHCKEGIKSYHIGEGYVDDAYVNGVFYMVMSIFLIFHQNPAIFIKLKHLIFIFSLNIYCSLRKIKITVSL